MISKFVLAVIASFVLFQMLTWQQTEAKHLIERRDAPAVEKNASQTIEDAFADLKSGLDDILKNIQNNELYQNVSQGLKTFGDKLKTEGEGLVNKIKSTN